MDFVAVYQVGDKLDTQEFTAQDWEEAYTRARECIAPRATLRGLFEEKFYKMEFNSKRVKIKIKPIVVKVEA